jgi:hypothetical protein
MTVIASTPKNPAGIDTPVGGAYSTGISNYPGGTLTINDVTPWPGGRSDGTSVSAMAQQESIARQYRGTRPLPESATN